LVPETGNHPASEPAFSVHLIEERRDCNGFTGGEVIVAAGSQSAYTRAMTLNKASFLALVGMILATILLVGGFIVDVFNVVRGLIPAMRLLTSFIYAFAGLSMVMFLYAFHKSQS
jgi:uncharacterized membrane protein YuzA (DUF378 family)